jgi:hypothetical protein
MKVSRWGGLLGWACLPGLLFLWSCRRETPSTFDRNLPPETYISRAPAESSLAYYRIRLFWNGEDPDGLINHYEFAVTDSNKVPGEDTPGFAGYYRTSSTDSVFVLKADNPQILGHRFYVRAVDNEGKVDPTPAWSYFVAHNFNFPGVRFKTAEGTWTDRDGNDRRIVLRSNDRFTATDTIGIGGAMSVSWDGFDVDDGGYVLGYQYRSSADLIFRGGSLADTSFARDFAPRLSGGKLVYFSGREMVQVRAVDDAGAKTQPDSVRSVIVNFNPVTWIVDPRELTTPVRTRLFRERTTGKVYPTGTTLSDLTGTGREIEFSYTAFDDHRDARVNPGSAYDISAYTYRKLTNGGGPAYDSTYTRFGNWAPFPAINNFANNVARHLTSADYMFLIRARDQLGRWGNPDTIVVKVNYYAFFVSAAYVDAQGAEQPLWVPKAAGERPDTVSVTIPRNGDGTYPRFQIRFLALDIHEPPPNSHALDINKVVEEELSHVEEYRARLNGSSGGFEPADSLDAPGDRSYPVLPAGGPDIVRSGVNTLELAARDASGRVTNLSFAFRVTLEQ